MYIHEETTLNVFGSKAAEMNLVKDHTGGLAKFVHANQECDEDQGSDDAMFLLGDEIRSSGRCARLRSNTETKTSAVSGGG